MKKSLLSLSFGTFALGVAEFGMLGILNEIAADIDISVVQAGNLISAYAAGVALGAPCLIFLRRMELRRLMLLLASVIAIGNAMVAFSPSYAFLLIARFISGLPHGAYFGAGAIACTRLADSGKGASAVAVLIGGMTVANLVGVPGFTYVCHALSWRLPFGIVAIAGIITFFSVRIWMPRIEALPDSGLKGQFRFLSRPAPWLIYSGIFFGQMSVYMWLSYISPIMTSVTGFPESSMTYIMVVVGAGMVFGNIVSGKMADRYAPAKVSMVIAALIVVVMPLIWLLSPYMLLADSGIYSSRIAFRSRGAAPVSYCRLFEGWRDAWGSRNPDCLQCLQCGCRCHRRRDNPPRIRLCLTGNRRGSLCDYRRRCLFNSLQALSYCRIIRNFVTSWKIADRNTFSS